MKKSFIIWGMLFTFLFANSAQAQVIKGMPSEEEELAMDSGVIPDGSGFQLSPDGKLIAFYGIFKEVPNVFVRQLNGGEIRQVSFIGDAGVDEFYWLGNTHIVFVSAGEERMLYVMDLATSEFRSLSQANSNVHVLYAASSQGIINFEMSSSKEPDHYDFCSFKANDKDAQVEFRNEDGWKRWAANMSGGLAFEYRFDQGRVTLGSATAGGKFSVFSNCAQFRALLPSFIDKGHYYCISDAERIGSALIDLDFIGTEQPREIFSKPGSSVERVFFSPKDHRPIMVWYRGKENGFQLIDKSLTAMYGAIKNELSGKQDFQIVSCSADEKVWIVSTSMADGQLNYYRYNVPNKELKVMNEPADVVNEEQPKELVAAVSDSRGKELILKFYIPAEEVIKLPTLLFFSERMWALPDAAHDDLLKSLSRAGFPIVEVDLLHSASYGAAAFTNGYDWWAGMAVADMPMYINEINKMFPTSPGIMPCGVGVGAQVAMRLMNLYPELKNRSVLINPMLNVNDYVEFLKKTNNDALRFLLKQGEQLASNGEPLFSAALKPLIVYSTYDVAMAELIEPTISIMTLSGNTPELVNYGDESGLCKTAVNREYVVSEINRYAKAAAVRKMK